MNRYCGNNKPYIYVYFPEEKKEQAQSVLEKLNASEEGSKINFWYSDANTLNKKETKRVEAAHALLAFADGESPDDARFKEIVNTVSGKNRNVMCVHLDELKYDTPWTKTQLGPQQAIKTRDYSDEASLVEKLKTAEIFRNMRVTKEQKLAMLRQLLTPVAAMAVIALCVLGYFGFSGKYNQTPDVPVSSGDIPPEIEILNIQSTADYFDSITDIIFVGNKRYDTEYYKPGQGLTKGVSFRGHLFDVYPSAKGRYAVPMESFGGNYTVGRPIYLVKNFTDIDIFYNNQMDYYGKAQIGNISSLENIGYMHNLKTLTIIGNQIEDISPIFTLDQLEVLILDCNPLSSIEGIEALTNLKTLSLNYTDVFDLSPAFKLPNLETLSINATSVKSVDGIGSLQNLKHFSAAYTNLHSVEDLFNCAQLSTITVNNSKIREMKDLGKCHNLQSIDVFESDLSAIGSIDFTKLYNLELGATNITDYSFLSAQSPANTGKSFTLGGLTVRGPVKDTILPALDGAKIHYFSWQYSDIESISELTIDPSETTELMLPNSLSLQDLSGIENYSEDLWRINFSYCPNIKDLTPLRSLPGIQAGKGGDITLDNSLRSKARAQLSGISYDVVLCDGYGNITEVIPGEGSEMEDRS